VRRNIYGRNFFIGDTNTVLDFINNCVGNISSGNTLTKFSKVRCFIYKYLRQSRVIKSKVDYQNALRVVATDFLYNCLPHNNPYSEVRVNPYDEVRVHNDQPDNNQPINPDDDPDFSMCGGNE
jgi:hypothetical protein